MQTSIYMINFMRSSASTGLFHMPRHTGHVICTRPRLPHKMTSLEHSKTLQLRNQLPLRPSMPTCLVLPCASSSMVCCAKGHSRCSWHSICVYGGAVALRAPIWTPSQEYGVPSLPHAKKMGRFANSELCGAIFAPVSGCGIRWGVDRAHTRPPHHTTHRYTDQHVTEIHPNHLPSSIS